MYAVVPILWILTWIFIDNVWHWISKYKTAELLPIVLKKNLQKRLLFCWILPVIFSFTIIYFYAQDNKWLSFKLIPLERKNIELILDDSKSPVISREQIKLLDLIKEKYQWTLDDGRLLIIAPPEASLWVFSYAHIWPRTSNLVVPSEVGVGNGSFSPMSIYSPNIVDYNHWRNQDGNHILAFLNFSASQKWKKTFGVNFDDFDVLASSGKNTLLQLKSK